MTLHSYKANKGLPSMSKAHTGRIKIASAKEKIQKIVLLKFKK